MYLIYSIFFLTQSESSVVCGSMWLMVYEPNFWRWIPQLFNFPLSYLIPCKLICFSAKIVTSTLTLKLNIIIMMNWHRKALRPYLGTESTMELLNLIICLLEKNIFCPTQSFSIQQSRVGPSYFTELLYNQCHIPPCLLLCLRLLLYL